MTTSPWVKRARANDLPSQAYAGNVTRATFVNDGFDEDAPIGSQGATRQPSRLTMKVVGAGNAPVVVTYERGRPVLWTEEGTDVR